MACDQARRRSDQWAPFGGVAHRGHVQPVPGLPGGPDRRNRQGVQARRRHLPGHVLGPAVLLQVRPRGHEENGPEPGRRGGPDRLFKGCIIPVHGPVHEAGRRVPSREEGPDRVQLPAAVGPGRGKAVPAPRRNRGPSLRRLGLFLLPAQRPLRPDLRPALHGHDRPLPQELGRLRRAQARGRPIL